MNIPARFAFVFMTLAIAACSADNPQACRPPRDYWQKPHNFVGLMPPLNKLSLTDKGGIYWNGERISERQLDAYLKAMHTMNPEPNLFLETQAGTPCRTIEHIRDVVDARLECKNAYSHCLEGIETVWQNLPSPP